MKRLAAIALSLALLAGCAAPGSTARQEPQAVVKPETAAAVRTGDNSQVLQEINQRILQLQQTISTITNNYALDAERAKLEAVRIRSERLSHMSIYGILVGVALLALATPNVFAEGWWQVVAIVAGFACMVGSVAIPFLVP